MPNSSPDVPAVGWDKQAAFWWAFGRGYRSKCAWAQKSGLFRLQWPTSTSRDLVPPYMRWGVLRRHLLLGAVLLLIYVAPVDAHHSSIDAYLEGDVIGGDVRFGSGQPGANVSVEVWLASGELVEKVETDSDGHFTFRPTRSVDHRFVYDPGDGHRCETRVAAASLPAPVRSRRDDDSSIGLISNDDLRVAVEEAVSKQVAPLRRELADARRAVQIRDVVGGLGYILGIVGIYCFLRSRRVTS